MKFLTHEQIKKQIRNEDDDSEDGYLELIGTAAEQAVENHLNRSLYVDEVPPGDETGMIINDAIRMAILLMVGQLYENREVTSDLTMKEVPMAYQYLLGSYRCISI